LINRITPIDTWRAIAALGVVWIHCWGHFQYAEFSILGLNAYKLLAVLGNGVDFFFVISGFCLFIVWKTKEINFINYRDFIIKRWLRIAPAFYAAALVILIYNYVISKYDIGLPILANLLFFQNYSNLFTISPPFWSLAVEFQFYLVLPLFLYFAKRNFYLTLIITFVIGNILLGIYYSMNYHYQIQTKVIHFLAGLTAAWIFYLQPGLLKNLSKGYFFVVGLILLIIGRIFLSDHFIGLNALFPSLFKILGINLFLGGFTLMLLTTIKNKSLNKKFSHPLGLWLGKHSYSIYLWHAFIITLVSKIIPIAIFKSIFAPVILFLLVLIPLIPLAWCWYELFEKFYFKKGNAELNTINKTEYTS
jgi:peptidoglycan/LPS O-acetylase OafA/YrhL